MKKNIEDFKVHWQEFDQEGTGFIAVGDLPKLIEILEKETTLI